MYFCKHIYLSQFFLRSESGHEFKWFPHQKSRPLIGKPDRSTNWEACFLGQKPLEVMSSDSKSQKKTDFSKKYVEVDKTVLHIHKTISIHASIFMIIYF